MRAQKRTKFLWALMLVMVFSITAAIGMISVSADDTAVNGWKLYANNDVTLAEGDPSTDTVVTPSVASTEDWVWYDSAIDTSKTFRFSFSISNVPEGDKWIGLFLFAGEMPQAKYGFMHSPENSWSVLLRPNPGDNPSISGESYYNNTFLAGNDGVAVSNFSNIEVEYRFTDFAVAVYVNGSYVNSFVNSQFVSRYASSGDAYLAVRLHSGTDIMGIVLHDASNDSENSMAVNEYVHFRTNNNIIVSKDAQNPEQTVVTQVEQATEDWLWYNGAIDVTKSFKMTLSLDSIPSGSDKSVNFFLFAENIPNIGTNTHSPENGWVFAFRPLPDGPGDFTGIRGESFYNSQVNFDSSDFGNINLSDASNIEIEYVFFGDSVHIYVNGKIKNEFHNSDFMQRLFASRKAYLGIRFWSNNSDRFALTIKETDNTALSQTAPMLNNINYTDNQDGTYRAVPMADMAYLSSSELDVSKEIEVLINLTSIAGMHGADGEGHDAWINLSIGNSHYNIGNFGAQNRINLMMRVKTENLLGVDGGPSNIPFNQNESISLKYKFYKNKSEISINDVVVFSSGDVTRSFFPTGRAIFSMIFHATPPAEVANWTVDYEFVNEMSLDRQIALEPVSATFSKENQSDITIAYSGDEFASISGNNISAQYYIVDSDNRTITIKKEYLAVLTNGEKSFTVTGAGGNSAQLTISIEGTLEIVIDNPHMVFDKNNPADFESGITFDSEDSFQSITGGGITEDDYTFENNVLTISGDFLASLNVGNNTFTVHSAKGKSADIMIVVKHPIILSEASENFNKSQPQDVKVTVTAGVFSGISGNSITQSDYAYDESAKELTIKKEFFYYMANGDKVFTISGTGDDNAATFTVTVSGTLTLNNYTFSGNANKDNFKLQDDYLYSKIDGSYVGTIDPASDGVKLSFKVADIASKASGDVDQWVGISIHDTDSTSLFSGSGLTILMRNYGTSIGFEIYLHGTPGFLHDLRSSVAYADEHTIALAKISDNAYALITDGQLSIIPVSSFNAGNEFNPQHINFMIYNGNNASAEGATILIKSPDVYEIDNEGWHANGITIESGDDGFTVLKQNDKKAELAQGEYIGLSALDVAKEITVKFKLEQIPGYHNTGFDAWFGVVVSKRIGDFSFTQPDSLVAMIRAYDQNLIYGSFGAGSLTPPINEEQKLSIEETNELTFKILNSKTEIYLNGILIGVVNTIKLSSFGEGKAYLSLLLFDNSTPVTTTDTLWEVHAKVENSEAVEYPRIAANPASAEFDKGTPQDLVFAISGDEFKSISGGNILESNYTYSNGTLTIRKEFLMLLINGDYEFVLTGGDNSTATITIQVKGTPVVPQILVDSPVRSFDKHQPVDLSFNLSGDEFKSLTGNGISSEYFTYADGVLVIKKEFCLSLPNDTYELTVEGDSGLTATITITITGEVFTQIAVTPAAATFDKANPQDITFNVTAGVLNSISGNSIMSSDYVIEGLTVKIRKEFLSELSNGAKSFTFIGEGENNTVTVTITVTGEAVAPTETPAENGGCGCGGWVGGVAPMMLISVAIMLFSVIRLKKKEVSDEK